MTEIVTPLTLYASITDIQEYAWWNESDGLDDPYVGFAYQWQITATVQTQNTGNFTQNFAYTADNVQVGDWIVQSSDDPSYLTLQIVEIVSVAGDQLVAIVEDIDRYNLHLRGGEGGILPIDPPDFFGTLIYRLGPDGLPIFADVLQQSIPDTLLEQTNSRFKFRNLIQNNFRVYQAGNTFNIGDEISLNSDGSYVLAQAVGVSAFKAIGRVKDIDIPGAGWFTYEPKGKVIRYITPNLPGSPGDILYLDPDNPGQLTATRPTIGVAVPIFIKIDNTTGVKLDEVILGGLDNFAATTGPVSGNDSTEGYSWGSLWVDRNSSIAYINVDPTATNAVWSQISSGGPTGPQGPAGATGPQGIQGDTGPQGLIGPTGADSTVTGPQGIQGDTGPAGTSVTIVGSVANVGDLPDPYLGNIGDAYIVEGNGDLYIWNGSSWVSGGQIVGPQGPTGTQGIQGDTGPQGIQGIQGDTGPQGIQGIQGDTGPQGIQGIQGETGPQGIQGIQGDTGPQGIQGETGPQGIQGETGPQGIQGIQGDTGPQGIQGIQGDVGATGPQGIQGIQGDTGPQGDIGPTGADSTVTGPQGVTGYTGPQGEIGPTGADSTVPGPQGPTGPAGEIPSQNLVLDTFVGDGTTTVYNLSFTPPNLNNIIVTIGGLVQTPTLNFSLTGNVLTFTNPPVIYSDITAMEITAGIGPTGPAGLVPVPNVANIASSSSITINTDAYAQFNITALAETTTINAPSGAPYDGKQLIIRIKSIGSTRNVNYNTGSGGFRSADLPLPTSIVVGEVYYLYCIYNIQDNYWDVTKVSIVT